MSIKEQSELQKLIAKHGENVEVSEEPDSISHVDMLLPCIFVGPA